MHAFSREQVYLATLVNCALALVIGGGVIAWNYRIWRRLATARTRSSLGWFLVISTVLACVSILNGLVAFAGPCEDMLVPLSPIVMQANTVWAPRLESAVLFVFLTGVAFACDNLITWRCYTLGKAMRGEPVPKWKTVLAHTYIWLLSFTNWSGLEIGAQVVGRRGVLATYMPSTMRGALPSILWLFGSVGLHVGFSATFVITFLRGLNRLMGQADVLEARRVEDLRILGVRSIVFAAASILLYIYAWTVFIAVPFQYQPNVTSTPYHLALLVLVQTCFIAKADLRCLKARPANEDHPGDLASIPEAESEEHQQQLGEVLSARSAAELGRMPAVGTEARAGVGARHGRPGLALQRPRPPAQSSTLSSVTLSSAIPITQEGTVSSSYASSSVVTQVRAPESQASRSESCSNSNSSGLTKATSRWGRWGSGGGGGGGSAVSQDIGSSTHGSGHGSSTVSTPQCANGCHPCVYSDGHRRGGVRHWRELFSNRHHDPR